ncbi:MAG: hypothetical protein K0S47_2496 [Herbinix sp.]|jgi:uncharacterized YigZ family protein|nr:hypothetical protein [Herbinix sp.]
MKASYKTIYEGGIAEISMKKSRFIATVCPAETEEQALDVIENLKKKYWDASHNCSAYLIHPDNPLMRCSDDGEPSKTAGWPMLDVLLAENLMNLVVVVTRYFGGTLLGTGGLVKAYQSAVKEGLSQSIIINKELGINLQIVTDYNFIGKIQYFIGQEAFPILSSEYTDIVTLNVLASPDKKQNFINKITELTNGCAGINEIEQVYFAQLDNDIHLFR